MNDILTTDEKFDAEQDRRRDEAVDRKLEEMINFFKTGETVVESDEAFDARMLTMLADLNPDN